MEILQREQAEKNLIDKIKTYTKQLRSVKLSMKSKS